MIDIWNNDFEWTKKDTYTGLELSSMAKTGKIWNIFSGTTYGENLPSNKVTSFYDLKSADIVFLSTDNGIYVYNYTTLSGYTINTSTIVNGSGLTTNNIYSITVDSNNLILYATTEDNIWRLNLKTNTGIIISPDCLPSLEGDYPPNNGIASPTCNIICYKTDQELTLVYFGFSGYGIWEYSYNENKGKIINTSTPVVFGTPLPNNNILNMTVDPKNDILYVITSTVLWSLTRTTNTGLNWYGFVPANGYYACPTTSFTKCVYYDTKNLILYVGFENDGIWVYDYNEKYGDIYDTASGMNIPSNSIYSIEKDLDKNILYASFGGIGYGIWSYNLNKLISKIFNTTTGVAYGSNLPNNHINYLVKEDDRNVLYGCTNNGLWKYNYEAQFKSEILGGTIIKEHRYQNYITDNINDVYFKLQKAFSGVSYTYTNNLDDIYKYDLLMGSKYTFDNYFNEYDIIDKHLQNFHIVDVASTRNIILSAKTFEIDGILLKTNHLVLLKDQKNTIENDIYQVNDKNYLVRLDYLSTKEKTANLKVYVKLGVINKDKQWFLFYNDDETFPTTYENKEFVEKHSYIIKHKLVYDIDSIPTSNTGSTHKLVFSDYDLARKINNKNYDLWTGVTIDVTDLEYYHYYDKYFDIYYYDNLYRIYLDKVDNPYDSYVQTGQNIIPIMTSNDSPIGLCSSSGVKNNSINYQPYKAFDSNSSTTWKSNSPICWLQYKFENPVIIYGYSIYFTDGDLYVGRSPKDWTFEASKDGITWDILDTKYTVTQWKVGNNYKFYEFENEISYIYYRLNILGNNGDIDTTSIGELKMYNIQFITGLTSYINYNSSYIFNSGTVNLSGETIKLETVVKWNNFTDLNFNHIDDIGNYIEIEFLKNNISYSKFNTTIKSTGDTFIILNDLIPEWVIQDYNKNSSSLIWIIKNLQHTTPIISSVITAIRKSFLSEYFTTDLKIISYNSYLNIQPKENLYNKRFDYDSLMFSYDDINYKFTTNNSYINYKLYDFLHKIVPILFVPNTIIYNNYSLENFTQYYIENNIIRLDINSNDSILLNKSFKPFTYVDITGSTNTGTTLILGITGLTVLLEKPNTFGLHENVLKIQNISTLKRISDILYNVYKNYDNLYYIKKNDYIRKNIYSYYGDILNECSIINFYCLGLLTEYKNSEKNFILRMYKLEDDFNLKLTIDYRPIELLDIGIDKKTMIPKPLIYPDYFEYTDRIDDLYLDDYNILEGNEWLIYLVIDNNQSSDIVIDDNI